MRIKLSATLIFFLFLYQAKGQQVPELLNDKEFSELAQLNPAFTGILEQLRVLANTGTDINIGLESRIFKTNNFISGNFETGELDQLRRKRFNLNLARQKKFENGAVFKYAGKVSYSNNQFKQNDQPYPLNMSDFYGFDYNLTQGIADQYLVSDKSVLDAELGLGFLWGEKFILGASFNHLTRPDVSILSNTSHKLPIEADLQFGGFFETKGGIQIFPNLISSVMGSAWYTAAGLSVGKNQISFTSQYERSGNFEQVDLGFAFRHKRYFFAASYAQPLRESGFNAEFLRITLNSTLRYKKLLKKEGLLRKLANFY